MEGQLGHNPIRVIDASSMFRREIDPNERPYTAAVLKANNKIVDEWESSVLKKICNEKGMIRDGQIFGEWQSFYTGKFIYKFMQQLNEGLIFRPTETVIEYWKKVFFSFKIEELMELGAPVVSHGWKMIIDENFTVDLIKKWEAVYSKSNDPLVWRKLNGENPKLWSEEATNHFWDSQTYKEIHARVMTVIKTPIIPV